ncbi:MAG: SsrA-binding protein SmpB [Rickettsiaceae bacterium]|nr:SsrA-binding protein SmpB [Rickettsiaceae bacterium]MDP4832117.1 SsrA-binding protein SmpB [Rickettsiaceae bacterium]MDP5020313.1 SsrA-binding protein SmpB [Rickettsiaceae bacterium]MDP5082633.1 SsrA-binding protein SmpB [Rickettsiaceae bacterium]
MSEYKKVIAQNKRALFEYFIEEKIEVGIVLTGSEVKSIRAGQVALADSHAAADNGELFLYNCHIAEYEKANRFNHATRRPRKLLLHKRELQKIFGKIKLKGYTLMALSMYFNKKNMIKVELGLSKGKKQHDKRQTMKENDWKREQDRLKRDKG